jgi:hypothetical protein
MATPSMGYGHTGGGPRAPLDFPKGDRSEALPFFPFQGDGSEGAVLLHPLPKGVAVAQPLYKGRDMSIQPPLPDHKGRGGRANGIENSETLSDPEGVAS